MEPVAASQGLVVDDSDEQVLRRAIDMAFDYRGDVTITCRGEAPLVGYVYDRRAAASLEDSIVRLVPADGSARRTIPYARVARLEFSGRDTAAGRSFQTWVSQYVRKKLAGESASLESEPLG
jgi:hypothetical protein